MRRRAATSSTSCSPHRRAPSCAASTGPTCKLAFKSKERSSRQVLAFVREHEGDSGIVYCASRRKVEELADALRKDGVNALPYHAGLDKQRARRQPGRLPAAGRRGDDGDRRLRHGHRQARRALRLPRRPAGQRRGLLPGDRPRRPRRAAGRHADALRPGRHAAAPHADRAERDAGRAQARRAPAAERAAGAGRGAALPAPDAARLFRRKLASRAATAISARKASSGSTARSRRRRRCRRSCAPASASAWSTWSPS